MASEVSFRNLDSIIKAAEIEASRMNSEPVELEPETPTTESVDTDQTPVPMMTAEDVRDTISNANIGSILSRIASNPDEISQVMKDSMKHMSPEAIQQARNLAMGSQGQQIRKEMQRRGIDPNAMRKQLLEQQKILKGTSSKVTDDAKSMIIVTSSRQIKSRRISSATLSISIPSILHSEKPIELSCSRLAQGPLSGKSIKVWYDPNNGSKNRRASKIIGFPVGGDMLIMVEGEDLSEKDLIAAEKFLA
jgi:hypothetical protein